jgi:uncharacterized membrane protein YdbT with pleckstrin-like domain
MENPDQTLADFMMSKATSDGGDDGNASSSEDKKENKEKNKDKEKDKEESESDKELKEAKKNSRAKANAIAFNPEMAKQTLMRLVMFYGFIGLIIIGLLIYSKRHEGWLSRGISKTISSIFYR